MRTLINELDTRRPMTMRAYSVAGVAPLWPSAVLVALAVVAYALSPIDLIPDFIPVLGYLDDLVLVPAGLALAIRLVPPDLLAEHRRAAGAEPVDGRALTLSGALMVVSMWLLAVGLLAAGWWVARG